MALIYSPILFSNVFIQIPSTWLWKQTEHILQEEHKQEMNSRYLAASLEKKKKKSYKEIDFIYIPFISGNSNIVWVHLNLSTHWVWRWTAGVCPCKTCFVWIKSVWWCQTSLELHCGVASLQAKAMIIMLEARIP